MQVLSFLVRLIQLIIRTLESWLSGISVVHRLALGTSEHQLSTPGDYSTTCNVVYREEQSRAAIPLPDVAGAQL